MFKLGEPAFLGSNRIAYKHACISRYPWHMKNGINDFHEKHLGPIIIPKLVNDSLRVWKENRASYCFDATSLLTKSIITFFWWMMVRMMMITNDIWKYILQCLLWKSCHRHPLRQLSYTLSHLWVKIGHGDGRLNKDILHYL